MKVEYREKWNDWQANMINSLCNMYKKEGQVKFVELQSLYLLVLWDFESTWPFFQIFMAKKIKIVDKSAFGIIYFFTLEFVQRSNFSEMVWFLASYSNLVT